MDMRSFVESRFCAHVEQFAQSAVFQTFESGGVKRQFYDSFIANLCKTHLKSPQILAFLYAAAPPTVAPEIQHNMLEELGLDDAGVSHPGLLHRLAAAAGFDEEMRSHLDIAAQEELRQMCAEPLLYGSLKEVSLSVLLEVTCFEWMLSRLAGRLGRALQQHRGLSSDSLEWFFHHAEVDLRHAEEGLDSVVAYIEYYDFDPDTVEAIFDLTFRENIFIKRYFGTLSLAIETAMLEPQR